jgi:LAO/AO transport system kinase
MTDMFVLLLQPGAGDELQGIKRGIMELADLILVNQADDGREALAQNSAREYRHALHLLRPRSQHWTVEVATCSARDKKGIDSAWEAVTRHQAALQDSGELAAMRAEQARAWLWSEVQDSLVADLLTKLGSSYHISELEKAVVEGRMPATTAADTLLDHYLKKN